MTTTPRTLDVQLNLLDRQVVDNAGRLVCKVDDLEMEADATGELHITAVLVGPRALSPRLGGRLGHWFTAIAARLADPDAPRASCIDFADVADIESALTLAVKRRTCHITALERWVDGAVIARIAGSRHESR